MTVTRLTPRDRWRVAVNQKSGHFVLIEKIGNTFSVGFSDGRRGVLEILVSWAHLCRLEAALRIAQCVMSKSRLTAWIDYLLRMRQGAAVVPTLYIGWSEVTIMVGSSVNIEVVHSGDSRDINLTAQGLRDFVETLSHALA